MKKDKLYKLFLAVFVVGWSLENIFFYQFFFYHYKTSGNQSFLLISITLTVLEVALLVAAFIFVWYPELPNKDNMEENQ